MTVVSNDLSAIITNPMPLCLVPSKYQELYGKKIPWKGKALREYLEKEGFLLKIENKQYMVYPSNSVAEKSEQAKPKASTAPRTLKSKGIERPTVNAKFGDNINPIERTSGCTSSLRDLLSPLQPMDEFSDAEHLLYDKASMPSENMGLFGFRYAAEQNDNIDVTTPTLDEVYLNVGAPFTAICIGVQGAGKSHTANVILENCLLPNVHSEDLVAISNKFPLTGLLLHFDQSPSNTCESVGLGFPNSSQLCHKVKRVVVLVSPTFYQQRKDYYSNEASVEVYPLLFKWSSLSATQLRKLMCLNESDSQLYASTMLNILRKYQRDNKIPPLEDFVNEVHESCTANGQSAPLQQRFEILRDFIRESDKNKRICNDGHSLEEFLSSGVLVVADLTDPLLSLDSACGVFQVLLEQFRMARLNGVGKVVAFDEAHKYLSHKSHGCVELTKAVVDSVRMMRHEGLRVLISTQSPDTMPAELLELASVTILHRFQSSEWSRYLSSKVTLPEGSFEHIQSLKRGEALVLSTKIAPGLSEADQVLNCITITVRRRLTRDLGTSMLNRGKEESQHPMN